MFIFKRNNYYYVEFTDPKTNKTKRITTGEKTRKAALIFITKMKTGLNHQMNNISNTISIEDFKNEYVEYVSNTHTSKYTKSVKLSFRMLIQEFGNKDLHLITAKEFDSFLSRKFRTAKFAAHLYYRTLKASFNKAIVWGYLLENPLKNISLPKTPQKQPTFITVDELNEIIKLTRNKTIASMINIAFYTGLRKGELINLKWSAVSNNLSILHVKNEDGFTTKNKKERKIPINDIVKRELLKLTENGKTGFVFKNNWDYQFHEDFVSHHFKKAVRKAQLSETICFHTLRHSFASLLVQKGISLYVVKELLGHSSIATTQIYSHLDNKALIKAVQIMIEKKSR